MKLLLCLTISIFLVGCKTTCPKPLPPDPVVITKFVKPDCGIPPKRSIIKLRPVIWGYMYDEDGDVVYTITPRGYEDLSFNTSEIIKGAKELKAEIDYYRECIEGDN